MSASLRSETLQSATTRQKGSLELLPVSNNQAAWCCCSIAETEMAINVSLFHLGDAETIQITELVQQTLGSAASLKAASAEHWQAAGVNVLVLECEQDGELCPAGRKFLRELKKSPSLASSGADTKVACLALARSVCENSANMLGADKWSGAARLQRVLVDNGCTPLVPMGLAEIEIEGVEVNVLPFAQQLAQALVVSAEPLIT